MRHLYSAQNTIATLFYSLSDQTQGKETWRGSNQEPNFIGGFCLPKQICSVTFRDYSQLLQLTHLPFRLVPDPSSPPPHTAGPLISNVTHVRVNMQNKNTVLLVQTAESQFPQQYYHLYY